MQVFIILRHSDMVGTVVVNDTAYPSRATAETAVEKEIAELETDRNNYEIVELPFEEAGAPTVPLRQAYLAGKAVGRAVAKFDLNVDAPEKVAAILRAAADAYQASAHELIDVRHDATPLIWARLAGFLDQAATSAERAIEKHLSRFGASIQR